MHHADPPLHLLFSALLLSAGLASCKRVVTTTTTTTYPDTGGDEADTEVFFNFSASSGAGISA